jgi:aryl-alcohol dehydrogenase-like predicted oxidoreductase
VLRGLGIGLVPYSPLGRGFLTGQIKSPQELADDDFRKQNPRFSADNFAKNLQIVREIEMIAAEVCAKPGQIALAWLLAQGDYIAPFREPSALTAWKKILLPTKLNSALIKSRN